MLALVSLPNVGQFGRVQLRVAVKGAIAFSTTAPARNPAVGFKDILPAQRAISREIEAGRLIETLLTFAIDLVSAERGLIFLARGERA